MTPFASTWRRAKRCSSRAGSSVAPPPSRSQSTSACSAPADRLVPKVQAQLGRSRRVPHRRFYRGDPLPQAAPRLSHCDDKDHRVQPPAVLQPGQSRHVFCRRWKTLPRTASVATPGSQISARLRLENCLSYGKLRKIKARYPKLFEVQPTHGVLTQNQTGTPQTRTMVTEKAVRNNGSDKRVGGPTASIAQNASADASDTSSQDDAEMSDASSTTETVTASSGPGIRVFRNIQI